MEHIKVVVRLRPFLGSEVEQASRPAWRTDTITNLIECNKFTLYDKPFFFDHIFPDQTSNEVIYQTCLQDLVQQSFAGIDTTVFAYGQTGAGKTHTVLGADAQGSGFDGVLFRTMQDIFRLRARLPETEELLVTCSYIEIYNEQVYDLLNKPENFGDCLQIFEDPKSAKFRVVGNTKVKVDSLDEVRRIMAYGEANRTYGETYFNFKSSRSHTIFSIFLRVTSYAGSEVTLQKESTINVVDLAGNERLLYENKERTVGIGRSVESFGDGPRRRGSSVLRGRPTLGSETKTPKEEKESRITESKNINKSLFFLTQVIYLSAKQSPNTHIPFRNSSLTKILRSSFGGGSRTLLILCLSPTMSDAEISLSTLRFGKCAKQIENKIQPNIVANPNSQQLQAVIAEYEQKIAYLEQKVAILSEHRNPIPNLEDFIRKLKQFVGKQVAEVPSNRPPASSSRQLAGKVRSSSFDDGYLPDTGLLFYAAAPSKGPEEVHKSDECEACLFRKKTEGRVHLSPKTFLAALEEKLGLLENFSGGVRDYFDQAGSMFDLWRENVGAMHQKCVDFEVTAKSFCNPLREELKALRRRLSFYEKAGAFEGLSDRELEAGHARLKAITSQYKQELARRKICQNLPLEDPKWPEKEARIRAAKKEVAAEEAQIDSRFAKFGQEVADFVGEVFQIRGMLEEEVNISRLLEQARDETGSMTEQLVEAYNRLAKTVEREFENVGRKMDKYQKEIQWLGERLEEAKRESAEEASPTDPQTTKALKKAKSNIRISELSPQKEDEGALAGFDAYMKPLLEHLLSFQAFNRSIQLEKSRYFYTPKFQNPTPSSHVDLAQIASAEQEYAKFEHKRSISYDKVSIIPTQETKIDDSVLHSIAEKVQMFREYSKEKPRFGAPQADISFGSMEGQSPNKVFSKVRPSPFKESPPAAPSLESLPITRQGTLPKVPLDRQAPESGRTPNSDRRSSGSHVSVDSNGNVTPKHPPPRNEGTREPPTIPKKTEVREASKSRPVPVDSIPTRARLSEAPKVASYAVQKERQKVMAQNLGNRRLNKQ